MSLIFGNTESESINFNGTTLDKVIFDETTVWERVKYIFNKGFVYGQGVLYESYDVHLSNAQYVSSSVNKIDENGNWVLSVTCNNGTYNGWNIAEFKNLDMVTYSKIVVEYDLIKGETYNRELFQIVWGVGDYKNYYTQNGVCELKNQKLVIDCSNRRMVTPYFSIRVGVVGTNATSTIKIKKIYLE